MSQTLKVPPPALEQSTLQCLVMESVRAWWLRPGEDARIC